MARMRTVKPSLRTDHLVATWPIEVRYFWVLLWGYLDDEGRGLDIPRLIAADCFPHDDKITGKKVDAWLTLMTQGFEGEEAPLCRYEVAGRDYIHAVNWRKHQKPNRPTKSRHPHCPIHERFTEPLTESSSELPDAGVREFEGLRGRGAEREPEPPPPRCADHMGVTAPPACGRCKEARHARVQWEKDRIEAIRRCRLCNLDGIRRIPGTGRETDPPVVCDHRPLRSVS